ncbi:hypothetical protein F5B18DRAFT_31574 [Nemania serpens]|nr:hypothetical protein F5B18DRAFT_31574 [Nemania serpens]
MLLTQVVVLCTRLFYFLESCQQIRFCVYRHSPSNLLMRVFSLLAEKKSYTRCWAPGFERSFCTSWRIRESVEVTYIV